MSDICCMALNGKHDSQAAESQQVKCVMAQGLYVYCMMPYTVWPALSWHPAVHIALYARRIK